MKFTTQFLTVLAASATLAQNFNLKCEKIISDKYSACTSIFSDSNYGYYNENYCIEFETKNCQKLYKTNIKDIYAEIPECKGVKIDEKVTKGTNDFMKLIYNSMKMNCAKDEQGNFCSYSPINNEKYYDMMNLTDDDTIKEICKSKKCVNELISIFDNLKKVTSNTEVEELKLTNVEELDKIRSLLKSEKCTAQNGKSSVKVNDKVDVSSDGTSNINVNGSTDASNDKVNISNGIVNGNTNVFNGTVNGNTNVFNGTVNGNSNLSNVISNGKTNTSNDNNNGEADASSGAIQVTYSKVLFAGLAILLSILF
jgi:hypothetical protein